MTYSWEVYNTTSSSLMEEDFCSENLIEDGVYDEKMFGDEVTSKLMSYYYEQLGEVENTLTCCLDDLDESPNNRFLQGRVEQAEEMFNKAQEEWDLVTQGKLPWLVSQ
jgi:hypothetical protein